MPTVYRNGRLAGTATGHGSSVVVEDATIVGIGPSREFDAGPRDTVVELDGALLLPAFVDAHVHLTATGLALTGLDLASAASLDDVLTRVGVAARGAPGRVVLGGGWDDSGWPEHRAPTAAELDRVTDGAVVYLARVDAHSAAVSSTLLAAVPELAGCDGFRSDGLLSRTAHDLARTHALAALRPEDTRRLQRAALHEAASLGIASVHEMAGPAISSAGDLAGALTLGADPHLPEVLGYWGELFGVEQAAELGALGAAGDLFCDGALGSHTAALHAPYDDRVDTSGMLRFDAAELVEHIARCERAGLQAGFHAIGDAAVDQVLSAFERAHTPAGERPHRIEHAEFVTDPSRLAATGLVASVQPVFDAAWGGHGGMYEARLGPARAARLNRFADLAAAGVPLAFGSDAPVTALGPWAAVRAAVHPHDATTALDIVSAVRAHTVGGRRAAGQRSAALAVGAPATFAAWDATLQPGTGWPDLHDPADLPTCRLVVRDGVPLATTV